MTKKSIHELTCSQHSTSGETPAYPKKPPRTLPKQFQSPGLPGLPSIPRQHQPPIPLPGLPGLPMFALGFEGVPFVGAAALAALGEKATLLLGRGIDGEDEKDGNNLTSEAGGDVETDISNTVVNTNDESKANEGDTTTGKTIETTEDEKDKKDKKDEADETYGDVESSSTETDISNTIVSPNGETKVDEDKGDTSKKKKKKKGKKKKAKK